MRSAKGGGLRLAHFWETRAHGEPLTLPDLIVPGDLIGYGRNPAIIRALTALGLTSTPTNFGFRSDSDIAQLAALRAGLGIGLCQKPLADREQTLRHVLPAFTHGLDMWLVTHPSFKSARHVRAALDGLGSGLAGYLKTPAHNPSLI